MTISVDIIGPFSDMAATCDRILSEINGRKLPQNGSRYHQKLNNKQRSKWENAKLWSKTAMPQLLLLFHFF